MKQIAGFEILGKLGQGGMGAVFKARQIALDRIVALKILPPEVAKDATFIERFQREARASARLNHPHIVQGIDVGQDSATGLWYFAMEYIEGPSLRKMLSEQKTLPETRALEIVRQVALALETVNANGMVHRDIKPDNILMTQQGEAKLADLGLAKQVNEDTTLTQAGMAVGSPHYMAPELARGKSAECDIRTDIYSLGATLFHLVTGRPPFTGETGAVIMALHLTEQPPKAHKVNPDVSEACSRLIEKMMQKKQAQRVQTPTALVQQIDKILTGEQTPGARRAIHPTGPRVSVNEHTREGKPQASNRTLVIGAVAGVVVLIGVAALLLSGRDNPTTAAARKEAVTPRTGETAAKKEEPASPKIEPTEVVTPPPEADPRELFKAAQEFEQKNPDAFDEAARRYQEIAPLAKGTAVQAELQAAISFLQSRRNAASESVWEATDRNATALAEAGDYDGALAALQAASPRLSTSLQARAIAHSKALSDEADSRANTILKKVEGLIETDPKTAQEALAQAAKIKFTHTRERVAGMSKKIEDARVAAAPKAPDPAVTERWSGLLQRFDEVLIESRDLKTAAEIAAQAKADATLAPFAREVKAVGDVMAAYDDMARFELDELAKAVGQQIELRTASTSLKGTLDGIRDGLISVKFEIAAGQYATKKVKLTDIPDAQRSKLTPPFQPTTDAQRIAICYAHLAKGTRNTPGATQLANGAPDFPLTTHVRTLIAAVESGKEKAQAEAAAPAAWAALQTRTQAPKLTEADARGLIERLAKFDAEFGKTDYATANREVIDAGKTRVWRVLHPNIVVNGDFEKNSWEGWERKGGSLSSQISTDTPHGGKYALYIDMQREYNATLTQTLAVEPQAEYRLSCWIKYLKGSLEQGRGGLFVMEGEGERRFEENRCWLPLLPKAKAGEWVKVEMKYVPQSATVRLEFFLRQTSMATERYYLLVDDIEFARVGK